MMSRGAGRFLSPFGRIMCPKGLCASLCDEAGQFVGFGVPLRRAVGRRDDDDLRGALEGVIGDPADTLRYDDQAQRGAIRKRAVSDLLAAVVRKNRRLLNVFYCSVRRFVL